MENTVKDSKRMRPLTRVRMYGNDFRLVDDFVGPDFSSRLDSDDSLDRYSSSKDIRCPSCRYMDALGYI